MCNSMQHVQYAMDGVKGVWKRRNQKLHQLDVVLLFTLLVDFQPV
jgi:hypothetical protein